MSLSYKVARDPREINTVERLKQLQNKEYQSTDDGYRAPEQDTLYEKKRDPREVNIVDRMTQIRNREPIRINDEDIQYHEMQKFHDANNDNTPSEDQVVLPEVGVPGGVVTLNEQGVIDPKYLPETYVPEEAAFVTAATHLEFPTVGESNILYLATEENNHRGYIYRWCEANNCYEKPYDALDNIAIIYGGDSN